MTFFVCKCLLLRILVEILRDIFSVVGKGYFLKLFYLKLMNKFNNILGHISNGIRIIIIDLELEKFIIDPRLELEEELVYFSRGNSGEEPQGNIPNPHNNPGDDLGNDSNNSDNDFNGGDNPSNRSSSCNNPDHSNHLDELSPKFFLGPGDDPLDKNEDPFSFSKGSDKHHLAVLQAVCYAQQGGNKSEHAIIVLASLYPHIYKNDDGNQMSTSNKVWKEVLAKNPDFKKRNDSLISMIDLNRSSNLGKPAEAYGMTEPEFIARCYKAIENGTWSHTNPLGDQWTLKEKIEFKERLEAMNLDGKGIASSLKSSNSSVLDQIPRNTFGDQGKFFDPVRDAVELEKKRKHIRENKNEFEPEQPIIKKKKFWKDNDDPGKGNAGAGPSLGGIGPFSSGGNIGNSFFKEQIFVWFSQLFNKLGKIVKILVENTDKFF